MPHPTVDIKPVTTPTEDEFYYGYRTLITYDQEGQEVYTYQPLTLDDFLDPQEGDVFMQGTLHYDDLTALVSIFRYLHAEHPEITVFGDFKLLWGIEGLSNPAPDVVVIPNVKEPAKPRDSFDVTVEGTRPIFILEVVSPRYRQPDRDRKVTIYEQVGVQEYFIVDSWLRRSTGQVSYEILGYRLQDDGIYTQIQPNDDGWLFSVVNNAWLGVSEARDHFFVIDGRTGQQILSDKDGRIEAENRATAEVGARLIAEYRAESEAARAAEANRRAAEADHRAQAEAERRADLERRLQTEAERRAQAERHAQAEAERRADLERRLQTETEARAQAEAERAVADRRLQDLATELAQLRQKFNRDKE